MEPRPVTLFHAPWPSGITMEFSVWRKPTHRPAASGLWPATALRYPSRCCCRQPRLQLCALTAAEPSSDAVRQRKASVLFMNPPSDGRALAVTSSADAAFRDDL